MRGTYLVSALGLAACRLNFDAQPSAGDANDAAIDAPLLLACNTPLLIDVAATGTNVSAIGTASGLLVAWLQPGGSIGLERITFGTGAEVTVTRLDYSALGTGYTMVDVASDGTANLIAAATTLGRTSIGLVADDNSVPGSLTTAPFKIATPHSLIATGRSTDPVFAIGGLDINNNSLLQGVARNAALLGSTFNIGVDDTRIYLVQLDAAFAPINSIVGPRCGVSSVNDTVTARGNPTGFGTDGQCSQATGAHFGGRNDMLLIRHDSIDGDLNYNIAAMSGTTVTPDPESRLRNPGNEAHGRGVPDGYWVTYETAGTVEAMHLDFGGVMGTPVVLGPLDEMTAQDVAVRGNVAYAAWLSGGLQIAQLCP